MAAVVEANPSVKKQSFKYAKGKKSSPPVLEKKEEIPPPLIEEKDVAPMKEQKVDPKVEKVQEPVKEQPKQEEKKEKKEDVKVIEKVVEKVVVKEIVKEVEAPKGEDTNRVPSGPCKREQGKADKFLCLGPRCTGKDNYFTYNTLFANGRKQMCHKCANPRQRSNDPVLCPICKERTRTVRTLDKNGGMCGPCKNKGEKAKNGEPVQEKKPKVQPKFPCLGPKCLQHEEDGTPYRVKYTQATLDSHKIDGVGYCAKCYKEIMKKRAEEEKKKEEKKKEEKKEEEDDDEEGDDEGDDE